MDESAPSISLPNQKNIVKFFRSFDVPQIVCIKLNQSKFLVNSVLLVLHSTVFEELIYGGAEEIVLDDSLQFPDADTVLHQCLLYLYGDTVNISLYQIPKFYHFATLYKIKSLQEQCEQTFIEHLTPVEKYIELLSEWSSNGRDILYKDLIIKNSVNVIKLMTSPKAFPTILKIIRSESNIHDTFLISAMLPCQDMLDIFYTEMTQKISEPSDAIQLNLIKNKYSLPFTASSRGNENHNDDSDSNDSSMKNNDLLDSETAVKEFKSNRTEFIIEKLTSSSSVATVVSSLECNTEVNNCNKKLADKEPHQNFDSCYKASSSCDRLTSISSSNSKSDLTSDVAQVKDFSRLVTEERESLLSLCFADNIALTKTIQQQDDDKNYVKMDIVLTWVLLKNYKISDDDYIKFCSRFNNKMLAKEYLLDVKEVLSNVEKSSLLTDCNNQQDQTFCVSSKVMPQSYVLTRIKKNGGIYLQNVNCKFGSCELESHELHIVVLLKKTWNDSATVIPNSSRCEIHSTNIIHVYLLGLDKDLFIKNIISLKVLTKAEIMQMCNQYANFVLKVVYHQHKHSLKSKSQLSLIRHDKCTVGSSKMGGSQDNLWLGNSSGANIEQSTECTHVFESRSWKTFSYAEFSKFIRTGYSKQSKDPKENHIHKILTTKSDFVYLCIDIFFSLVCLGKFQPLKKQSYQSFISEFDLSLISAEFVKDVKTVFNTALPTSLPVCSKKDNKTSFSVSVFLNRKSLQNTINNKGIISGVFENQCKMSQCQTEKHTIDIQIRLNKSGTDLSVDVNSRKEGSNIHKRKMLHFYLLALNTKEEATQLISLKLLSKSEVLRLVERSSLSYVLYFQKTNFLKK